MRGWQVASSDSFALPRTQGQEPPKNHSRATEVDSRSTREHHEPLRSPDHAATTQKTKDPKTSSQDTAAHMAHGAPTGSHSQPATPCDTLRPPAQTANCESAVSGFAG